jgi:multidrug resistance efflux pump
VIKAQAELTRKNTEVEIAKKEAERMNALSNNSQSSINYMNAETEQIKARAMLKAAENGSLMMVPFGSSPQVHVNK